MYNHVYTVDETKEETEKIIEKTRNVGFKTGESKESKKISRLLEWLDMMESLGGELIYIKEVKEKIKSL